MFIIKHTHETRTIANGYICIQTGAWQQHITNIKQRLTGSVSPPFLQNTAKEDAFQDQSINQDQSPLVIDGGKSMRLLEEILDN